jgi:hypothetical protein
MKIDLERRVGKGKLMEDDQKLHGVKNVSQRWLLCPIQAVRR